MNYTKLFTHLGLIGGAMFAFVCLIAFVVFNTFSWEQTGIFAIIFFLFSSGFQLSFNGRTCVYAFVYSLIVMVSLSFSLVILRYIGISESGIITSTGTLILTSLTGFYSSGKL